MGSLPPAAFILLVPLAPLVLVYLAGIALALLNMGDYRKASAFALTGFVGLLLGAVIRAAATLMTLPQFRGDMPASELGIRLAVTNYTATFLTAAAMVFLIVAIFIDRERPDGRKREP
jgi:formate hydrogenlyase subunit 3/multisubunit Na+/H+ antiporter MnhD subunit